MNFSLSSQNVNPAVFLDSAKQLLSLTFLVSLTNSLAWDNFLCTPGWTKKLVKMVKGSHEFLNLQCPSPKCCDYRGLQPHLGLCGTGDLTEGLMCAKLSPLPAELHLQPLGHFALFLWWHTMVPNSSFHNSTLSSTTELVDLHCCLLGQPHCLSLGSHRNFIMLTVRFCHSRHNRQCYFNV